ncbi:MAG: SDR family oxidoreductase [Ilumatobacteraceae bacterium]
MGRALAREFHHRGARRVVVADLDGQGAEAVAAELDAKRPGSAFGLGVDISSEAGNVELIRSAWDVCDGTIDLFFANAGVGLGTDPITATEEDWDVSFRVNIHAHRWAAKELLPDWLERSGYFAVTASPPDC